MNNLTVLFIILFTSVVAVAAETPMPQGFADTVVNTGKPYLIAVAVVTNSANATKYLQGVLAQESSISVNARHARILLARIEHPDVFADLSNEIAKWREPSGRRPGFLSGVMFQFVKRGPESKYVEERVRDKDGKIVFELSESSKRETTLKGIRAKVVRVKKYSDAEVQAGIARNAAARQAVLEHFLKFLGDSDAYEQSEIVDAVYRLWGSTSHEHRKDEPLADGLIEVLFMDSSRPIAARMSAANFLPDSRQPDIQKFMLDVVTNNLIAEKNRQNWELLDKALSYLESTTDATALSALKSQTNGPKWKVDRVAEATRKIELRLFPRTKNNLQ